MGDGEVWYLKTDFRKYFESVNKPLLRKEYKRKISCPPTMRLLDRSLLSQPGGLQIGRLSSQLSANLYAHQLDRWLVHDVRFTRFFRYMDDVVFVAHSKEALKLLFMRLKSFISSRMKLELSHWHIQPALRGINFVGYRIWDTHKLLRKGSVTLAKRKMRKLPSHKRELFTASWLGHAAHADTHNLLVRMGLR